MSAQHCRDGEKWVFPHFSLTKACGAAGVAVAQSCSCPAYPAPAGLFGNAEPFQHQVHNGQFVVLSRGQEAEVV